MKANKTRHLLIKMGIKCKQNNRDIIEAIEELEEIEELSKIGVATTDAFDYFSMGTVDEFGKEYFCMLSIEDLLEWYEESNNHE